METAVEHFGRYGEGAVATRRADTLLVASRTDFVGAFHNTALRVSPDTAPGRVVDEARAFGGAHDRPIVLWVATHRDQDLAKEAQASGFELRSTAPGMALRTPPPEPAVPADVELIRVADRADSEAFAAVHREVFVNAGRPAEAVDHFASPDALLAPNVTAVLARVNGTPASCAMLIHNGPTAGIYWVATTPATRNRGLGTLVTTAVARLAFEHGAQTVTLQATELGAPVYHRIGFTPFTTYHRFLLPRPRLSSPQRRDATEETDALQ
ncbi:GNAT family N-acetyltransferase [Kribbella capetownensis]|uniref:GNAT family N-acetyltransferase n=1 Tax=Kribbella capetownensis TaxID=1572659 RepID=UPI0013F3EE59|nr:GNAT family N-acetyltransferase [Kribbella capetownensis]